MGGDRETDRMLNDIYSFVQERMDVPDLAHGWDHILRVYTQAKHIAEKEHADMFVVAIAALLHDLGHTQPTDKKAHHADVSAELATEILQAYPIPLKVKEAILHAIVTHSFSRGAIPQTLEASVVRDADRLDALGAIGIARWAIVGSQKASGETRLYYQDDPFGYAHHLDDRRYILDHFSTKLLLLPDTMMTKTGRQIARERADFMVAYLNELKKELTM